MSYTSLKFLVFILGLMVIYYLFPKKYRWNILLVGNLVFYAMMSGKLLIFAIISGIITYAGGILISKKENKKKLFYLLSVLLVLGFLVVLKYNNFLSSIINPIISHISLEIPYKKFILPIGISYYTLEMIAYLTDVYRKKYAYEKNPFKLLTFFTFFPKVVEGPISRYDEVKDSLFGENKFDYDKFRKAFVLIGYGFFKKLVIADRAGIFVDTFFKENHSGILTIMVIIMYTIQIYFDFSGCIDIITGVAELYGVKLPQNFNRPFFSKSISEFWRRWHITLGTWLKDYVFYPISLSKMNMKLNMKVRKFKNKHLSKFIIIAFPLFFVWFANGLWHGPSIKYISYGLYYYVLMMLGVLLEPVFTKLISLLKINTKVFSYKFFQIVRTTIIVMFGLFMFRCDTLKQTFELTKTIGIINNKIGLFKLGLSSADFIVIIVGLLIVFGVELASELKIDVRSKLEEQNLIFRWIIYLLIIFSILIFGIYGKGYSASSFIYGGF